jgi:hypothetical protein
LLLVLLTAQITLGALTVLTEKHYVINSLHVVTGASVLATMLVLTLRTRRAFFDRSVSDTRRNYGAGSRRQDPAYRPGRPNPAYGSKMRNPAFESKARERAYGVEPAKGRV